MVEWKVLLGLQLLITLFILVTSRLTTEKHKQYLSELEADTDIVLAATKKQLLAYRRNLVLETEMAELVDLVMVTSSLVEDEEARQQCDDSLKAFMTTSTVYRQQFCRMVQERQGNRGKQH